MIGDATNASAGNIAPNNIGLEVDPQHMWLTRSVFAKFDFDALSASADEQWVFTLEYRPVAGGTQFYLETQTVLTSTLALPLGAAATYSVILHRTFERPFLLKPGAFVSAGCNATLTAGSYLITLGVDVIAPPL
ncbi:MAG TPA: hypothetical protein VFI89_09850 [Burkholderiales bacterium]|nr:hypothetical protein [Burkholderiales bacterium]